MVKKSTSLAILAITGIALISYFIYQKFVDTPKWVEVNHSSVKGWMKICNINPLVGNSRNELESIDKDNCPKCKTSWTQYDNSSTGDHYVVYGCGFDEKPASTDPMYDDSPYLGKMWWVNYNQRDVVARLPTLEEAMEIQSIKRHAKHRGL